mgnify:FL=1
MENLKCPNCSEKGLPLLKSIYFRRTYCENCGAMFGYNASFWDLPLILLLSYSLASRESTFLDNFYLIPLILIFYPLLTYKFRKMTEIYRDYDPVIMTFAFLPFAAGIAVSEFLFSNDILPSMALILSGGLIFGIIDYIDFKKRRTVKEEITGSGNIYK